jgi:hypothetical protein
MQNFGGGKNMKKVLLVTLTVSLLLSSMILGRPAAAIEGTSTISSQDLYSLAQRKTYRLGLRGAFLSPTDNINLNKESAFDFTFEFDAKLNENLDTGPRIGFASKKLQTTLASANYTAMKFGYGARIYTMYWGEYGSSHGFFNLYFAGELDYYAANKTSDISAITTSPANFAGLGVYGGVGLELAFGPNTGGFIEGGYQRTSVKSADNQELPLDGYTVAAGARLSFF